MHHIAKLRQHLWKYAPPRSIRGRAQDRGSGSCATLLIDKRILIRGEVFRFRSSLSFRRATIERSRDFRLPALDSQLSTPDSRLPASGSGLRTSGLPILDSALPASDSHLQTPGSKLSNLHPRAINTSQHRRRSPIPCRHPSLLPVGNQRREE